MTTTTTPSTGSAAAAAGPVRGADEVLGSARHARQAADAAEVQVLIDAVDWAVMNPPLFARDAAAIYTPTGTGDRPVREDLTATGVPDVDRAAVAELGLALGVSTQAAGRLLADALELAYRLPHLWTRLVAGEVKPCRARKVAQATRPLARLAAAFVDRELAPLADRVSGPQLEGLMATAMARHDQDLAAELAAQRAEQRHLNVDLRSTTLAGLTPITGNIDLPDAHDLEAALSQGAAQLAAWGSEDPLDVRRARALGDLARDYLTHTTGEQNNSESGGDGAEGPEPPRRSAASKRKIVLYAHLTETAILDMIRRDNRSGRVHMGRVENTDTPITAETIREWVNDPHTTAIIRPVLDLNGHQHASAYEVPGRIKEHVRLRDGTCQFPGCHAQGLYCQYDHTTPYDHEHPENGGQTETSGLALLCQLYHNLKTHHGYTYTVLTNGAVLWRTPHGLRIRRNRDGTTDYLRHHRRYCDDEHCPTCTDTDSASATSATDAAAAAAGRRPVSPGSPLPELEADPGALGPPPF
ncbi:DUF222 domain-containing protein [Pseudactinotalea sp.]|uniref:HNH endonuclease signature motif containing protein n=1 Tax=Pseudactinotalea sp. TaxID=1926260 RepID=UPI003B3A0B69